MLAEQHQHRAARVSSSSGGMNRVRSWTVIERAASSTGRSQSGSPGVGRRHSVTPRCSLDQASSSSADSMPPNSSWAISPSASTKRDVGEPTDPRELVGLVEVAARVGERGVGHAAASPPAPARCRGSGREVDAEHRHLVAVLSWKACRTGISFLHGCSGAQMLITIGPRSEDRSTPGRRRGRAA